MCHLFSEKYIMPLSAHAAFGVHSRIQNDFGCWSSHGAVLYFCYVRFALDDRGAAHLDGCSLAGMAARHLGPSWWAQRAAAEHGPR